MTGGAIEPAVVRGRNLNQVSCAVFRPYDWAEHQLRNALHPSA